MQFMNVCSQTVVPRALNSIQQNDGNPESFHYETGSFVVKSIVKVLTRLLYVYLY